MNIYLFVGEKNKSLIPKEGRKSSAFVSPTLGTGLGQGIYYTIHFQDIIPGV